MVLKVATPNSIVSTSKIHYDALKFTKGTDIGHRISTLICAVATHLYRLSLHAHNTDLTGYTNDIMELTKYINLLIINS